jgi:hypothetical protein
MNLQMMSVIKVRDGGRHKVIVACLRVQLGLCMPTIEMPAGPKQQLGFHFSYLLESPIRSAFTSAQPRDDTHCHVLSSFGL